MQGGKDKIAAGVAKATSRTILRPTTKQVEIAAACSKNGFLEVPFLIKRTQFFLLQTDCKFNYDKKI
jgi:hypothetical protein